ncbi:MAG: TolC family protein [Thermoanaerobaculia bacterium]
MFGREEKREEFLRGSRATGAAFATWWLSAVCAPCPAILLVAACAGAIRAEAAVASFEENPPAHVVIFASAEADALVAEALANNPELAAARQETSAARARVAAAGTLPDPMLSLAYVNDGASPSLGAQPMSRLELGAQQAIPFPGKLGLQQRVAKADADRAATVPERVALGLEAAVRRTYAALLEARENLRLVGEQVETWSQIEEVVRARYSAGLGTQQDVLRAQSERTRLLQQRRRDEAAERSSLVEIRQLLFRPTDAPVPTGRRLVPGEVAVPAAGEVLSRAEEDTPEVKEAALAKERAQFAGELARRNLRPDFVASVGYANRGGLPLMWSAGVGISVPLWAAKKQRPLIAEAESQLESASATEVSLRRRARARTEERLIRIRQLEEESRLDAGALLIQDRLAVEAALASYRTGSVPFVTVLEALSTNFSDRRAAIARLADLLRADADLREFSLERTAAVASAVDARASSKGGM